MLKVMLLFVVVICFAAVVMAHEAAEVVKIADLVGDPNGFAGRPVVVEARVVAISADGQSLELFDSPTYTRISVQLAQLPKAERKALIRSDVREVQVRGRVSTVTGRLTIQAESIQWNTKGRKSGRRVLSNPVNLSEMPVSQ